MAPTPNNHAHAHAHTHAESPRRKPASASDIQTMSPPDCPWMSDGGVRVWRMGEPTRKMSQAQTRLCLFSFSSLLDQHPQTSRPSSQPTHHPHSQQPPPTAILDTVDAVDRTHFGRVGTACCPPPFAPPSSLLSPPSSLLPRYRSFSCPTPPPPPPLLSLHSFSRSLHLI
ncbi:unnamed protein product [Cutaneotrichosporon oleaginosum]